jgi:hypothetical protein
MFKSTASKRHTGLGLILLAITLMLLGLGIYWIG